jgi:hypothetical protein
MLATKAAGMPWSPLRFSMKEGNGFCAEMFKDEPIVADYCVEVNRPILTFDRPVVGGI